MKQSKLESHAEAIANTVAGVVLNMGILWAFSVPMHSSILITSIMIFVSYVRGFAIRRFFNRQKQ